MFDWRNIYISTNREEFFRMKMGLEEAEIPIKTSISAPNRSRINSTAVFGGNPLIMNLGSRDTSMREEYRISVKKENEEFALYTMRNLQRGSE